MLQQLSELNPTPSLELAQRNWFRLLRQLNFHRQNTYVTYDVLASRVGLSMPWVHDLFKPLKNVRAGKRFPMYQIDLVDKITKALGVELVSFPQYDLVRIPLELEARRKATRISYADLAPLVDVTTPTMHRWLTGRTVMPVIPMMRLMDCFGMEPLTFLGELQLTNSDPSRKPWGMGDHAQSKFRQKVSYRELPNGDLVAEDIHYGAEISPDGTIKWFD